MKFTKQGIDNIKNIPSGIDAAIERVESLGGKVHSLFMTMGEYDMVAISEMPSDDAAMGYLLELAFAGNVRTQSLKAFSIDKFRQWAAAIPSED
jgi:uncharacterized protein with GYD domain